MTCKPPDDERYPKGYDRNKGKRKEDIEVDRVRESRQRKALDAIINQSTFRLSCILLKIENQANISGDRSLEFALKGLLRCALTADRDAWEWRRLLGTSKKKWEYQGTPDHPTSWRSRILFRYFPSNDKLTETLSGCPLACWPKASESQTCSLTNPEPVPSRENAKFALLQLDDVCWEDNQNLSMKIIEFIRGKKAPAFSFISRHCCLDFASSLVPTGNLLKIGQPFPMHIYWQVQVNLPLHSGMSQHFAEALYGKLGKVSRHFIIRNSVTKYRRAVMISSLKGLLRSTVAWLFEHLGRLKQTSQLIFSSDFAADYATPPAERPCPIQALFGGTGQEGDPSRPGWRSLVRLYGTVRQSGCLFQSRLASYLPGTPETNWQNYKLPFVSGAGNLEVETISLDGSHYLVTEISPGPHAHAALLALCLAVDLIGAGFFRLGRFTSRGFGIIRLRPIRVECGTLADYLEGKARCQDFNEDLTGLQLAQELGFVDPLAQLAAWLQDFIQTADKEGT